MSRGTWRIAACGAAAAALLAGQTWAKTPDTCLKPEEMSAFEVRTFQVEMQVYADACKALDAYNAMVTALQPQFQAAAADARKYFARTAGRAKANARQLEFETRYAAQAEMRRIRGMRTDGWFCINARKAMEAATAAGAAGYLQHIGQLSYGKEYSVVQCVPRAPLTVAGLVPGAGAKPAATPAATSSAAAPAAAAAAPAAVPAKVAAATPAAAPAAAPAPAAPAKPAMIGKVTVPAPLGKPPVPYSFANRASAVVPASGTAPAAPAATPKPGA